MSASVVPDKNLAGPKGVSVTDVRINGCALEIVYSNNQTLNLPLVSRCAAPTCAPGMTGTPPNCVPTPAPTCAPGMTGTPPNCVPTPAPTCAPGMTGTPPNCVATPAPTCAPGMTGTPPNCVATPAPTCAPGMTGTPPNCVATPVPTTKPPVTPAPTTKPLVTPTPTTKPLVTPAPTTKPPVTPAPTTKPPVTPAPTCGPNMHMVLGKCEPVVHAGVVTPAPTCAPGMTGTPPNCVATPAPTCAPGMTGTPPNCVATPAPTCAPGMTGTPPNCVATPAPTCAGDLVRQGGTCKPCTGRTFVGILNGTKTCIPMPTCAPGDVLKDTTLPDGSVITDCNTPCKDSVRTIDPTFLSEQPSLDRAQIFSLGTNSSGWYMAGNHNNLATGTDTITWNDYQKPESVPSQYHVSAVSTDVCCTNTSIHITGTWSGDTFTPGYQTVAPAIIGGPDALVVLNAAVAPLKIRVTGTVIHGKALNTIVFDTAKVGTGVACVDITAFIAAYRLIATTFVNGLMKGLFAGLGSLGGPTTPTVVTNRAQCKSCGDEPIVKSVSGGGSVSCRRYHSFACCEYTNACPGCASCKCSSSKCCSDFGGANLAGPGTGNKNHPCYSNRAAMHQVSCGRNN